MKTTVELVDSGSTTIEVPSSSRLRVSYIVESITDIVMFKSEQTISVSTQSLAITTEKAPITLIETSSITKVDVEVIGSVTTIQSAITGIKGDRGDKGDKGDKGEAGTSGAQRFEEITLSLLDIQNKFILLQETPIRPKDIEFSVFGGVEQRPLFDFGVDGNKLFWEQLALELLLEAGMTIAVRYNVL